VKRALLPLVLLLACTRVERATPTPTPTPAPTPAPPPSLAAPTVRTEVSTRWCDQGPRTGRLLWDAVPGAHSYQVDELTVAGCCDYQYPRWPDSRWQDAAHTRTAAPETEWHEVTATYYRVRALPGGAWTAGMWPCSYE